MKKRRQLGRGVAVVGAGISKFGMFKDKDSKDLFTDKSHNNAPLNPKAQFPLTIRDMMAAKMASAQKKGVPVPPRSICVDCYGSDMEWIEMKGKGRLAAFTCINIPPPFMIAQGYSRKNPYCTGVVELEEGVRVDARIEGVDCAKPEDISVGMPLKVKYLHREEGEKRETYLAFEPL